MMLRKFLLLFITSALLMACGRDRLQVPVEDITIDFQLKRFDQDLLQTPAYNARPYIDSLQREYGRFFELYSHRVIQLGDPQWKAYPNHLRIFLTDFRINEVQTAIPQKMGDLSALENELYTGFQYFRYHFPRRPVPRVYTMISGFNQSIVTDSALVAIGLDNYLGRHFYLYARLGWPKYKRYKMIPEKIPSDVFYAYAQMEFPYEATNDRLLNRMIHHGKALYFAKAMLPQQPDSLIMGYSKKQMQWCRNNEAYVWAYFLEHKLLFSDKHMIFKKYLGDGPFTSSFTRQAPARIGQWLGYQIVREYMNRHPEVSLPELMNNTDYQALLNQSNYEP